MTDTTNVTQMPARPARRRKGTATPAAVPQAASSGDGMIAMALGELTGVVSGVEKSMHEMKEDMRHDRESRARIHQSIDDLKDRVHDIDLKVSRVLDFDTRLGQVEAEVAKTRRIREWATHIFSRGWKFGVGIAGFSAAGAAMWFREQLGVAVSRISNLFM